MFLAVVAVGSGLGFVQFFNAYELPGEHWAPASPIVHETARFATNTGAEGDYLIQIEKVESKFPLLFVEYQPPGMIVDTIVHSDDGMIRLSQQFADEGQYRISVQDTIHPERREVLDFTVQTPLIKYATDLFFFVLLLLAGLISGKRLHALMIICMALGAGVMNPDVVMAHGMMDGQQNMNMPKQKDDVSLQWLQSKPPAGAANRKPLDWSLRITRAGKVVHNAVFDLDIVHSETGFPVLHLEGIAKDGVIPLKYSPPDGADYQLQLRSAMDGRTYHLALEAAAQAIHPTATRQWQSFVLLMVPVSIGMFWGWKWGERG